MFFREDEIRRIKQEEEAKATLKREAAEKLRQREIDVLKAEQAEKRVKFKFIKYCMYQGFNQDLETGCPELLVVRCLGTFFQGGSQ